MCIRDSQAAFVAAYFEKVLFPVLTPLAVDRSRPFPMLSNKSLNLGLRLKKDGETAFAVVQVPSILPRLVELPSQKGRAFILLETLLTHHLGDLFELHDIDAVSYTHLRPVFRRQRLEAAAVCPGRPALPGRRDSHLRHPVQNRKVPV